MEEDVYYNISHTGQGQLREKMSRFLAFAVKVHDADEAKRVVKGYQNEYHDARHVCWAYVLGADGSEWQLNDNGEPSGTAGKPILGQIRSAGVTDVVVAVVRYFGGIKLGTSGLIAAYREAARLALEDAGKVEMHSMEEWLVEVPYVSADGVMKLVKSEGIEIVESQFGNLVSLRLRWRCGASAEYAGRIANIEGVQLSKL